MKIITGKRAQGLSMTTIIIAVIALIVLVVLIAVFTGRMSVFSIGVKSCVDKGGSCTDATTCTELINGETHYKLRGSDCEKNEPAQVCCIALEKGG